MILLIDGYNVLKQLSFGRQVSEGERSDFISLLSQYRRIKKHAIVLVFDGGPSTWPSKEVVSKVQVIFSGSKRTADAVIMKYMKEHVSREIVLISSDNELCRFANKLEMPSLGSHEFYEILQDAVKAKQQAGEQVVPEIDVHDVDEDLDSLMEAGSKIVPTKQEDMQVEAKLMKSKTKQSKTDRLLLKILNKL